MPGDIRGRTQRYKDNVAELTGAELNINGDNNRLLSSLLCAALYPNVAKVLTPEKSFVMSAGGAVPRQPLPSELRFKTNQDGFVFVHPSSINATVSHFSSPFLVYQEQVKTSKIFIRECTMIPLLPLVLFSGSHLNIELHAGEFVILLRGNWIMMQASSHKVNQETILICKIKPNKIYFLCSRLPKWLNVCEWSWPICLRKRFVIHVWICCITKMVAK